MNMKKWESKVVALFATSALFILFLSALPALAQSTTGVMKGTVVDVSNAVVAGATVKVKNEATGGEVTTTSNGEGNWEVGALLPGSYTVTTESGQFKKAVRTGVKVQSGTVTPVDVKLEAGAPSETVTVTASTEETLQTEQSQISATIDTRRVEDLPSNGAGGGIDTLALLIPGVVANRVGGTNTNGTGLSVNGQRGRSNNFQIDGSDNNDLSVGGPALFVDFQDAIQEFQVVTNNFDASYGRNQGAIVNIITKSGGNDFHGSAFWHHQDAKNLNSINNTDRRDGITENLPNLYNVYGGTVGGPVYLPGFGEGGPKIWSGKDRAFFFAAYQGIRNPALARATSTSLAVFTTDLARLQSAFPGNAVFSSLANFGPWSIPGTQLNASTPGTAVGAQISTNLASACAKAIPIGATPAAGCTYTTPNNPATGSPYLINGPYDVLNFGTAGAPSLFQAAQYERTVPVGYNEDYWSVRFDIRPTTKDNVTFRYLSQQSASQNAVGTISTGWLGDLPAGSKNWGGNWSHAFGSKMLNDFRASYNTIQVDFGGGCDPGTAGCIPTSANLDKAFANISFAIPLGLTKTGNLPTLGGATNLPQGRTGKVYQFADTLTRVFGKHSVRFGAEFKYLNTLVPFLPNFNGTYSFNTAGIPVGAANATRIINNAPSAVSIVLGDPLLAFIEKDQYYFAQDDWKVRSNLTLNLGVRYEYTGQPINQLNEQGIIRESDPATRLFNPALPISQRTVPLTPVDKNNFAPRIGFAYTPHFWKALFGEDRTVFRGGYSIAYDAAFYNILVNVMSAAPFAVALTIPAGSLPATASPAPIPYPPFGNNVRDAAAASGVLPRGILSPQWLAQTNVANDFRSPYSEQMSFGIQRRFGKSQIIESRWVSTHGVGLFQNINGNFFIRPLVSGFTRSGLTFPGFASLLPAGTTAQNCFNNPATLDNEAACDGRQLPQAGVTTRANTSQSIYHGFQNRYNGRFFRDALTIGASYTFSKAIDDSSEIFAFGDIASPNAQNPFCINRCERGLSNLNRPHVFSTNFIFDVPVYRDQRGVLGRILGGWQINGTYIRTSGQAYTPANNVAGTLGLGTTYLTAGDRPFWGNPNADNRVVGITQIDAFMVFGVPCVPSPCTLGSTSLWSVNSINSGGSAVAVTANDVRYIINGPGAALRFGTPFGNVARNTERGPIFNNVNLSLFKNIKIWERVKMQFRAEAFNAFNHPNPGFGVASGGSLPVIALTSAGAEGTAYGEFTDIGYANRVIQLGLRIVF